MYVVNTVANLSIVFYKNKVLNDFFKGGLKDNPP